MSAFAGRRATAIVNQGGDDGPGRSSNPAPRFVPRRPSAGRRPVRESLRLGGPADRGPWVSLPLRLAPLRPNVHAAVFTVGFMLGSHGPGIARDLYVNIKMLPPGDATTIAMQIMETNWTGRQSLGVWSSFVAGDASKLAREGAVTTLTSDCTLAPPFA